jgi:hypothetical protein
MTGVTRRQFLRGVAGLAAALALPIRALARQIPEGGRFSSPWFGGNTVTVGLPTSPGADNADIICNPYDVTPALRAASAMVGGNGTIYLRSGTYNVDGAFRSRGVMVTSDSDRSWGRA